jgi:predicted membrane protein
MRLNLTRLNFTGTKQVVAKVALGDLEVRVPRGVGVEIHYKDALGDVNIEGQNLSHGVASDDTWRSPRYNSASKRLDLDLEVAAGSINVTASSPGAPATVPTAPTLPPYPKLAPSPKLPSSGPAK